jgi:hypothetical protein
MAERTARKPAFSTKKKKYGGGKFKNESKAGFSGGAQRALAAR